MKRVSNWFVKLSKVGKASVISALFFGVIGASAVTNPAPNVQQPVQDIAAPVGAEAKAPVVTHRTEVETKPVAYGRQTVEDSSLPKGATSMKTPGQDGVLTITHNITLTDGRETGRETSEELTKAAVDEITAVGTYVKPEPKCDTNYSGCVPVVSYDLDCADIGFSVIVYGYDKHGFDRDRDGYGCESY